MTTFRSLVPRAALLALNLHAFEAAAAPLFTGLGDLAGGADFSFASGISADGNVVVGTSQSSSGDVAVRWTPGSGLTSLGSGNAYAASADGAYIVGKSDLGSGPEAFRWSAPTGMVGLGDLAGGSFWSYAAAVSADGSVVGGASSSGLVVTDSDGNPYQTSFEAFRWSSDAGMTGLGAAGPGTAYQEYYSGVSGISADGLILSGGTSIQDNNVGFYWTAETGMVITESSCSDFCEYEVYGISADGSTLVGGVPDNSWGERAHFGTIEADGSVAWDPIYWATYDLERLVDASADGSVAVGGPLAAIYFAGDPDSLPLQQYLEQLGLDLTGWTLAEATAISDDGRAIVGYGTNPDGFTEGWYAVIPEPSTAALVTCGLLALGSRRGLRARRGQETATSRCSPDGACRPSVRPLK